VDKYIRVRLDTYSETPLIDIHGTPTTAKQWAKVLGLDCKPGIILLNEGKEQSRIDGRLYHFHFKEALRYISGKYYE